MIVSIQIAAQNPIPAAYSVQLRLAVPERCRQELFQVVHVGAFAVVRIERFDMMVPCLGHSNRTRLLSCRSSSMN